MQIETTIIALRSKKFKKLTMLVDDTYTNFQELLDMVIPIARDTVEEEFIIYQIDLPQFDLHFNPNIQIEYQFHPSDQEMMRDAFSYLREGTMDVAQPVPTQIHLPDAPPELSNTPAFVFTTPSQENNQMFRFEQLNLTPKQLMYIKQLLTAFEVKELYDELASLMRNPVYMSRDITNMLKEMVKDLKN